MLEILKKYNELPRELRAKLAAPEVLAMVEKLENIYERKLSQIIMRVMIKELEVAELVEQFVYIYKLERSKAEELVEKLKKNIFCQVSDYLKFEDTVCAVDFKDSMKQVKISVNVKEQVERVIDKAEFSFASEMLANRFKDIIKTNIVGVRDCLSVKETLAKPVNKGGVGLNEEEINKVIKILKCKGDLLKELEKKEAKKEAPAIGLDVASLRDVPYDLNKLREMSKKGAEPTPKKPLEMTKEELSAVPVESVKPESQIKKEISSAVPNAQEVKPLEKVLKIDPAPQKELAKEVLDTTPEAVVKKPLKKKSRFLDNLKAILPELSKPKETVENGIKIVTKPSLPKEKLQKPIVNHVVENGKVKMEDIRYVKRTMGPIDELAYLSLMDFRRLHQNPAGAIIKIKEKIDLLGEYSYERKQRGIKAWRQNPVNRLYLKIGELSMAKSKPIKDIAEDLKQDQKDYLNEDEFNAIGELNNELKYF